MPQPLCKFPMNPTSDHAESSPNFSTEDFAKALEQEDCQFQKGQIICGTVFSHDSNGAYVDIRGKSAAFMPIDEASLRPFNNLADIVPLNTIQEFVIIREQNE